MCVGVRGVMNTGQFLVSVCVYVRVCVNTPDDGEQIENEMACTSFFPPLPLMCVCVSS